eukprot:GILJ01007348.1.p1 GENE.GILJ01007348.1~~GILJ01007348.1.p1  ORF type:complete len:688 (-),score=84.97 GILJ01007348.1:155-2218(-)
MGNRLSLDCSQACATGRHGDVNELVVDSDALAPRGQITSGSLLYLPYVEQQLMIASGGRNVAAVRWYLAKGADPSAADEHRTSPLHVACRSGSLAIVEELLNAGAPVNGVDSFGWSSLHICSLMGRCDVIQALLEAGADVTIVNKRGHRAIDLATDASTVSALRSSLSFSNQPTRSRAPTYVAPINHKRASTANAIQARPVSAEPETVESKSILLSLDPVQSTSADGADSTSSSGESCEPETPPVTSPANGSNGHHNVSAGTTVVTPQTDVYRSITDELAFRQANLQSAESSLSIVSELDDDAEPIQVFTPTNTAKRKSIIQPKTEQTYSMLLNRGIRLFNLNHKKGVSFLIATGCIQSTAAAIAQFLKTTAGLNKTQIGNYLGESEPIYLEVLEAFTNSLDFEGQEFHTALRAYLSAFRLPGEAQKIDRIMEQFAKRYFSQNVNVSFASQDAVYMLAFSTIMLNVDAHNPGVKSRMTKVDWIRNNRSINNGSDFDKEFLERLYDDISQNGISYLASREDLTGNLFTTPDHEGWLQKQGGRIKTWKDRWFILSDNCLYYFRNPDQKTPQGLIPLEKLQIGEIVKKKFMFSLNARRNEKVKSAKFNPEGHLVQGNHSKFVFRARDAMEMENWIGAIESSMERAKVGSLDKFYERIVERTQVVNGDGKSKDLLTQMREQLRETHSSSPQ